MGKSYSGVMNVGIRPKRVERILRRGIFSVMILRVAAAGWTTVCRAEQPRVCIGFDPAEHRWGNVSPTTERPDAFCPPDMALFSLSIIGGPAPRPVTSYLVIGNCCPLPAHALGEEQTFVEERCPENAVATGARVINSRYLIRCTSLNTKEYELAAPKPGWDIGWESEFFLDLGKRARKRLTGNQSREQLSAVTTRSRIPMALRYGLLRESFQSWETSGCIGHPWGSIVVARSGKDCEEIDFAVLLKKTSGESVPAEVYPDCDSIDSVYSEAPRCLKHQGALNPQQKE